MNQYRDVDGAQSPTRLIDAKIASLNDWRGTTLARLRDWIRQADPYVLEAVKWRKPSNMSGVPVWEHAGIICTGETYEAYVKLTFAKGALASGPVESVQRQPRRQPRDAPSTFARMTRSTRRPSKRLSAPPCR